MLFIEKLRALFDTMQNYWLGEHVVRIIATAMPILAVLGAIALCVVVRGWFNYLLFSTEEEKKRLHDGNPAFVVNQLFVLVSFALSLGATMVNTLALPAVVDKMILALIIQVAGMGIARVVWRKSHHRMMAGSMLAGIRLGVITLVVGITIMFGMLR
jgi:uncharacterized membrane protein YjfL (UPF0719 family)